jgi:SAM-dependent methyltransferase
MIKIAVSISTPSVFRVNNDFSLAHESFRHFQALLSGKKGIEIGGPSSIFAANGLFPVYPIASHLDNCNYGGTTVWEGEISEGQAFQFHHDKSAGRQYIAEATEMGCIPSASYDFVISSHMLEHTANPILALSERVRLLKDQGYLVLLLPHKDGTFDHRRPVTTIQHLIADYE